MSSYCLLCLPSLFVLRCDWRLSIVFIFRLLFVFLWRFYFRLLCFPSLICPVMSIFTFFFFWLLFSFFVYIPSLLLFFLVSSLFSVAIFFLWCGFCSSLGYFFPLCFGSVTAVSSRDASFSCLLCCPSLIYLVMWLLTVFFMVFSSFVHVPSLLCLLVMLYFCHLCFPSLIVSCDVAFDCLCFIFLSLNSSSGAAFYSLLFVFRLLFVFWSDSFLGASLPASVFSSLSPRLSKFLKARSLHTRVFFFSRFLSSQLVCVSRGIGAPVGRESPPLV